MNRSAIQKLHTECRIDRSWSRDAALAMYTKVVSVASVCSFIIPNLSNKATIEVILTRCKDMTELMLKNAVMYPKVVSKQRRLVNMTTPQKLAMTARMMPKLEAQLKKIQSTEITDNAGLLEAAFETAGILNLTGNSQAANRFIAQVYMHTRALTRARNQHMLALILANAIDMMMTEHYVYDRLPELREEFITTHAIGSKTYADMTDLIASVREAKPKNRQQLTELLERVNAFGTGLDYVAISPDILIGISARAKEEVELIKGQFVTYIETAMKLWTDSMLRPKVDIVKQSKFRSLMLARNKSAKFH